LAFPGARKIKDLLLPKMRSPCLKTLAELYRTRDDLIRAFPEVVRGDLRGLVRWAVTYGVTVDPAKRLLEPCANEYRELLHSSRLSDYRMDKVRSALSKKYLQGVGVDIGPLQKPFQAVNNGCVILKADIYPRQKLVELYPEILPESISQPNILCDGETLATFRGASVDFVIASHVLEHLRNPIGAIENWTSVLKEGGYLVMLVPHKGFTFDKERPLTEIHHLLQDYRSIPEELATRDFVHYLEWARLVEKKAEEEIEARAKVLQAQGYSIHRHVFDETSWSGLMSLVQSKMGFPFKIVESCFCSETAELVTVCEKRRERAR